jgi:hypothetical protein
VGQGEPDDEREGGGPFVVPPEHEAGAYANALAVWHSAYEFTLDFAAELPNKAAAEDDPESSAVVARVVARIRLPAALMFDVLRALNASMTRMRPSGVRSAGRKDRETTHETIETAEVRLGPQQTQQADPARHVRVPGQDSRVLHPGAPPSGRAGREG